MCSIGMKLDISRWTTVCMPAHTLLGLYFFFAASHPITVINKKWKSNTRRIRFQQYLFDKSSSEWQKLYACMKATKNKRLCKVFDVNWDNLFPMGKHAIEYFSFCQFNCVLLRIFMRKPSMTMFWYQTGYKERNIWKKSMTATVQNIERVCLHNFVLLMCTQ